MDFLYDFIINNTTLIIIVAVLLAMALIGYIAEDNGYGPNKKEKNNEEDLSPADEELNSVVEEMEEEQNAENQNVEILFNEIPGLEDNAVETVEEAPVILAEEVVEEPEKPTKESLNIDKDFSKLLDDEEDIVVGDTETQKLNDIDDDLWKF